MSTRLMRFVGIGALLGILYTGAQSVSAYEFVRDLRVGDTGPDVLALQQILNESDATRVASSGTGSPGSETSYFGLLTADAVRRYQELHREEILTPLGLLVGTGFVGSATRAHISNFSTADSTIGDDEGKQYYDDDALSGDFNQERVLTSEEVTERNQQNLDYFLDFIDGMAEESGLSQSEVKAIKKSIQKQAETPFEETMEQFIEDRKGRGDEPRTPEEILEDIEKLSAAPKQSIFAQLMLRLLYPFTPNEALAQYAIPVGGPIYFYYYCSCSNTWIILLGQPRPGLVDYETGTQAYFGYNLPYSSYLMGWAEPVGLLCVSEPELECALEIPSTYGLLMWVTGSPSI